MRLKIEIFLLALIALLLPARAGAVSFDISPVNVFLDPGKQTERMTVKNLGDNDLSLQIKLYVWTQDAAGMDVYTETKELIVFPKIVTLKKGDERIIRIGAKKRAAGAELTYRIFIEELPASTVPAESPSVPFLSRVGIPVFLNPEKKAISPRIESLGMKDGKLDVLVKNDGNCHFIVKTVMVRGKTAEGEVLFSKEAKGWYLLSGISRPFTIPVPAALCGKVASLDVIVSTDSAKVQGTLDVIKTMCGP
jgi:fimbrial chaperone protein